MNTKKKYLLLTLIIALGLFLRIYNIENAPPGVYPDEAVNGIDALTANTTGNYQWFYEANNGREGMFMNLIALCFKFLGVSVLTLKLPSIIFGTLTILGVYLLTKELFRRQDMALVGAYLTATSFWAINFSRISFRANTLPTILVFSFYFLWRGMRTKKFIDFAVGGLIFGLGLHTYISFRIAPAILIVMLLTFFFTREKFLKEYWKQIAAFIVFAFLSAFPIIYTFYVHPQYLASRSGSISILNPEVNQGQLIPTFLKSFGLSLVKYNFWGDQNWRHNYPPYPILDPITGIAFTFGLIYALLKLFRYTLERIFKKENFERLEIYVFLTAWFFIMLAPEFMTAEGNPHALRAIGTLPVVFIFSSILFRMFVKKSEHYSPYFRTVIYSLLGLMLVTIGLFNSLKYHYLWANNPETGRAFEHNLMEVVNYIHTLPDNQEKFVVTECMQRIPIQVFTWDNPTVSYFYPGEIDQISPKTENDFEIIMTNWDEEAANNLKNKFPDLSLEEKKDRFGISYYILK